MNIREMLQNNRKAYFSCMWLFLRGKSFFINICSLPLVWSKKFVKTNLNFPQDLPLFKLVKKKKILSISVLLSEVTFWNKKRSFQWISPKMLQTNRNAYFSSIWCIFGGKTGFVNICPLLLVRSKIGCLNNSKFS